MRDPTLEFLCLRFTAREDQRIKPGFIHHYHLLISAKGLNSSKTLFVIVQAFYCSGGISEFQHTAHIRCNKPHSFVLVIRSDLLTLIIKNFKHNKITSENL